MRSLIMTSPEGVFYQSKALTSHQLRLLQSLAEGSGQKEKLVQKVWGYTYHPLRHDPMLYSTLKEAEKDSRY